MGAVNALTAVYFMGGLEYLTTYFAIPNVLGDGAVIAPMRKAR
jgi:hypothetical protein